MNILKIMASLQVLQLANSLIAFLWSGSFDTAWYIATCDMSFISRGSKSHGPQYLGSKKHLFRKFKILVVFEPFLQSLLFVQTN